MQDLQTTQPATTPPEILATLLADRNIFLYGPTRQRVAF